VIDDGTGIEATAETDGGFGLVNLRRRAEKLRGSFVIESPGTGGTSLVWQVPVP
jgi:signal transduction histidine kinase